MKVTAYVFYVCDMKIGLIHVENTENTGNIYGIYIYGI